jgi:hypothetical protein
MTDHFYDFTEELGFLSESWDARKVENLIIEEIGVTEGGLDISSLGEINWEKLLGSWNL